MLFSDWHCQQVLKTIRNNHVDFLCFYDNELYVSMLVESTQCACKVETKIKCSSNLSITIITLYIDNIYQLLPKSRNRKWLCWTEKRNTLICSNFQTFIIIAGCKFWCDTCYWFWSIDFEIQKQSKIYFWIQRSN